MRAALLLASLPLLQAQEAGPTIPLRLTPMEGPGSPATWNWTPGNMLRTTGGAVAGLVIHEAGHWLAGTWIGAGPSTKGVKGGGGIPFFAVTYARDLTPREQRLTAGAGLTTQFLSAEWLLSRHPRIWEESRPWGKGIVLFHLATSAVYSYAAYTRTGPQERDTLGIAEGLRVPERQVGTWILVPAALDLIRLWWPELRWPVWASRVAKVHFIVRVMG